MKRTKDRLKGLVVSLLILFLLLYMVWEKYYGDGFDPTLRNVQFTVIVETNLYESPSTNSDIVSILKEGDIIFLSGYTCNDPFTGFWVQTREGFWVLKSTGETIRK